jgi:hypothetical protein
VAGGEDVEALVVTVVLRIGKVIHRLEEARDVIGGLATAVMIWAVYVAPRKAFEAQLTRRAQGSRQCPTVIVSLAHHYRKRGENLCSYGLYINSCHFSRGYSP